MERRETERRDCLLWVQSSDHLQMVARGAWEKARPAHVDFAKRNGRPRTLTPKQEQQLFRWINGKDPRQYGFDFGMWTRLIVRKLIADKFEANLGVTAVGKLLRN